MVSIGEPVDKVDFDLKGKIFSGSFSYWKEWKYVARDADYFTDRDILVKMVKPAAEEHALAQERLTFEIRLLKKLKHSGVIKWKDDSLLDQGELYLVTEYGCPVMTHISRRVPNSFEAREIGRMCRQLLAAVAYLHQQNVTHNMIGGKSVLVTDVVHQFTVRTVKLANFDGAVEHSVSPAKKTTVDGEEGRQPEKPVKGTIDGESPPSPPQPAHDNFGRMKRLDLWRTGKFFEDVASVPAFKMEGGPGTRQVEDENLIQSNKNLIRSLVDLLKGGSCTAAEAVNSQHCPREDFD